MTSIYNRFRGNTYNQTSDDGNWYVVGDIHGQYDQLMSKLEDINFSFDKDKLFACGDLVDRGPKSWEVLSLVYEPWFYSVLGNHEQIMYDCLVNLPKNPHGVTGSHSYHMWTSNGGIWWFVGFYDDIPAYSEEAIDIIENLPNFMTLNLRNGKSIGIIHASANGDVWPPRKTLLEGWGDPTIWSRKINTGPVKAVKGVDLVVVGHNGVDEPLLSNNTLHIDTQYKSGELTILNLEGILC